MKDKSNNTDTQQLLAKALNFAELINYQTGSVVSKTIIGKKTGSVTLFSFDKGQGLSEHTAPFDALVFIVDGEAKITISSKLHNVVKGQMIVMPANRPHALKAVKRFKMVLVMIKSNETTTCGT